MEGGSDWPAADPDAAMVCAMRAAVAEQRRVGRSVKDAYRANRLFHLALVEASGNPFLTRFVEAMWAGRVGLHAYLRQADPAELSLDADEHEQIAAAVERGDADEAERLTRAHIGRALERLRDSVGPP